MEMMLILQCTLMFYIYIDLDKKTSHNSDVPVFELLKPPTQRRNYDEKEIVMR